MKYLITIKIPLTNKTMTHRHAECRTESKACHRNHINNLYYSIIYTHKTVAFADGPLQLSDKHDVQ